MCFELFEPKGCDIFQNALKVIGVFCNRSLFLWCLGFGRGFGSEFGDPFCFIPALGHLGDLGELHLEGSSFSRRGYYPLFWYMIMSSELSRQSLFHTFKDCRQDFLEVISNSTFSLKQLWTKPLNDWCLAQVIWYQYCFCKSHYEARNCAARRRFLDVS